MLSSNAKSNESSSNTSTSTDTQSALRPMVSQGIFKSHSNLGKPKDRQIKRQILISQGGRYRFDNNDREEFQIHPELTAINIGCGDKKIIRSGDGIKDLTITGGHYNEILLEGSCDNANIEVKGHSIITLSDDCHHINIKCGERCIIVVSSGASNIHIESERHCTIIDHSQSRLDLDLGPSSYLMKMQTEKVMQAQALRDLNLVYRIIREKEAEAILTAENNTKLGHFLIRPGKDFNSMILSLNIGHNKIIHLPFTHRMMPTVYPYKANHMEGYTKKESCSNGLINPMVGKYCMAYGNKETILFRPSGAAPHFDWAVSYIDENHQAQEYMLRFNEEQKKILEARETYYYQPVLNLKKAKDATFYHADVNKAQAEQLLQNNLEGSFLLRPADDNHNLTISLINDDNVIHHYEIQLFPDQTTVKLLNTTDDAIVTVFPDIEALISRLDNVNRQLACHTESSSEKIQTVTNTCAI